MNLCFIIGKHQYVYEIPYIFLKHVLNKKKTLNYEIISIKQQQKNNNYTFNKTCLFLYNFFGKAEPLT